MTRVYLVRHGRAAAGWDNHDDPGLDDVGMAQAAATAARLGPLGPLPIVSSPKLRCRETAAPLAERWAVDVVIEPAVVEIPSPEGVAMDRRTRWLREAIGGPWSALGERYTSYRTDVVQYVAAQRRPVVIFSHFVAINAVIGTALDDDRIVVRSLDNASVTVVDVDSDGTLTLVEGGHEAETLIR